MEEYKAFTLHFGFMETDTLAGLKLSDDAKETILSKLPGTRIVKRFWDGDERYPLDNVTGIVLECDGKIVAHLHQPLAIEIAGVAAPYISAVLGIVDDVINDVHGVDEVVIMGRKDDSDGFIKPFPDIEMYRLVLGGENDEAFCLLRRIDDEIDGRSPKS